MKRIQYVKYVFKKGIFMKFKKGLSALALLLALTVVGCNGNKESSKPAASSAAPSAAATSKAPSSAADTSKAPSSAPASSAPAEDPLLTPLARTYTDGTAAKNSSDKDYIPLTDATANKVGVKIAITNYTLDMPETTATGMGNDGKINPGNDHNAYLRFRIVAPKAGNYQMVMRGKSKSDALEKTLNDRAFDVKLNGTSQDTKGDRAPLTDSNSDFVAVPTLALTGQEDTIDITASDYRIQFDVASFIIFNEI